MQLKISIVFFISMILLSCSLETNKEIVKTLLKNNNEPTEKKELKKVIKPKKATKEEPKRIIKNIPIYFIGEPYFIEGVEYIPKEDYNYNQTGLASYYGPELHRKRTINNEYNKVTELLSRHKTLPLPSVVKITNLENGFSITVRVNDRGPQNNARIIEVSRKVAQLLRFYKTKIAKVRVEILSDPSKQLKIVTQSMSDPEFNKTIDAAPTEGVTITDLEESIKEESNLNTSYEQPIELGFKEIPLSDLFIKIRGLDTYQNVQNLKDVIQGAYRITTQKEIEGYSIIFGPMLNQDADNLFQILISKGYKQSEIIIK